MRTLKASLELIKSGAFEEALAEFARLENEPELRTQVWGHRAFLLAGLGRFEESVRDWKRFTEANPTDIDAKCHLASSLIGLGSYREGLSLLTEIIEADPSHPRCRNTLQTLYAKIGTAEPPLYNHMAASRASQPLNPVIQALEADHKSYPASVYPEIGRFLYNVVRLVRPKIVVETGTCYGYSALCMAQALKDQSGGHLYCFDVFGTPGDYVSPVLGLKSDKYDIALGHLESAQLTDYVTLIRGDSSTKITDQFAEDQIDIAFIDGDHLMKGAILDFNAVAERLRVGGLMLFHDINPETCRWLGPRYLLNKIQTKLEGDWQVLNLPSPEGCGVAIIQKQISDVSALGMPPILDLVRQRLYKSGQH